MAEEKNKAATPKGSRKAVGVSGLREASGIVYEEFLSELKGQRGRKIYREMSDNDPTIGALLSAIELPIAAVKWTAEPSIKDDPDAFEAAQFVEGMLFDDMQPGWKDFIMQVLTMLRYGWSWFEIVYKMRNGMEGESPSKFDDGFIGIKKLGFRAQDSLHEWKFEDNEVTGMVQLDPNKFDRITLPLEKSLHFTTSKYKENPEGRSVLRNCYRPWYFMKNIQNSEAIGIERDLTGFPVIYAPSDIVAGKDESGGAVLAALKQIVRDIRVNSQSGLVLSSDVFDGTTVRQMQLELIASAGTNKIDTDKVILRYQRDITRALLADFLMLGSDKGSYALSRDKTQLFNLAMEFIIGAIEDTINNQLLPKIWYLNGLDFRYMPKLKPGKIASVDLVELGDFLLKTSSAGFNLADPETESYVRDAAGLPAGGSSDELGNIAGDENNDLAAETDPGDGVVEDIDPKNKFRKLLKKIGI